MKRQLKRILSITVAWTIVAIFQFLMVYSTILQFDCNLIGVDPSVYFWGNLLTGVNAGVLGGSMLVFGWEKWLRSKHYGAALLDIFWTFVIVYFVVGFLNSIYFNAYEKGLPFFSREAFSGAIDYFMNLGNIQSFLFWLITVLMTLVFLQVSDKYGPGIFFSFLMGKYFTPKREERIFMFLDLRSSTTIAEQLGEERYFNFIRQVFEDVTPAIINAKGQIYQYVGDEIVISWDMDQGLKNANCVQCFFDIQKVLNERAAYYEELYDNIRPVFKAGMHFGPVMAGEVGVVKRDIAYSGDVLNTTARIQSKCNELGVDILISKFLYTKLGKLITAFDSQGNRPDSIAGETGKCGIVYFGGLVSIG